jgi:hypothetical protein
VVKKSKKNEDGTDKPKKKMSAYMNFVKTKRASIAAENKDATFVEMSKIMGKVWGTYSQSAKDAFKLED